MIFYRRGQIIIGIILLLLAFLNGCSQNTLVMVTPGFFTPTPTPFQPLEPTKITQHYVMPTATASTDDTVRGLTPTPSLTPLSKPTLNSGNMTENVDLTFWMDESVPLKLRSEVEITSDIQIAGKKESANLILSATKARNGISKWVFVLAAPFPTVEDGVELEAVKSTWLGREGGIPEPILMSQITLNALSVILGEPAEGAVRVVSESDLLDIAWAERSLYAILPFEALEPRWKVLRVDEKSPLDKDFNIDAYPLTVRYRLVENQDSIGNLVTEGKMVKINVPLTNRDAEKMTTVVMTGVTALVRATGAKMEQNGMGYPARDILPWLKEADILHISNEVSFAKDCPPADPYQRNLIFCSRPEYIELLDLIGVDVIELSGNHLLDWGPDAFLWTLDLYDERGWKYYAGGHNEREAREPLKITHHGNHLAFIGCNVVGPPNDWASDTRPGSANCLDYGWIHETVTDLAESGYLPIVTLQHNEFYSLTVTPAQKQDFPPLALAGAVIVSGSQAHYPNPFDFVDGRFIHYGLGNLFFDQMDHIIQPGIQREFIDRHVFYENRHISTEILTVYLEDFAKPRPMTEEERKAFLEEAFEASGW